MDTETKVMAAIFGAVLFLVTALLVGPAFAVSPAASPVASARRQQWRRSAATAPLGAFFGALILGVLAAVAVGPRWGGLGGGGGGRMARHPSVVDAGRSFDIPMIAVIIVLICAVLAALTAAMIPALRLGRLDIVGVMKGQNVSPRTTASCRSSASALFALGAAGSSSPSRPMPRRRRRRVFGLVGGAIA